MEQIQLINTLDSIARVSAKDCVVKGDSVIFMVPEEQIGKAIGKNGSNIKAMTQRIKKKVELFEYAKTPEKFLEKAFYNAKLLGVEIKDVRESKVAFVKVDAENKNIVLSRLGRLKKIKELAKRNYNIDEVRIVGN